MEAQDSFALSRNGFQESASRMPSSKCPSSKSLPTHLKYSQRNDASGNWYTCSFGTHKSNLLAEINADRIAGSRSRTLSGHPDDAVRILMLSERLRNLEPRLRSSEAFFRPTSGLTILMRRQLRFRSKGPTQIYTKAV